MRFSVEPEHLDSPKQHPCMGADVPSLCTDLAVHRVTYYEDDDNSEAGHAHLCGPHALAPKEPQLDPDRWGIEPIRRGSATQRLGQILQRLGGLAHPEFDTTKVHIRPPKRGPVEGQMDMFELEAGEDG